MPLAVPVQQEVARKTLMPLFPKNWASCLLRGEMLGSQNRKKESSMEVAKRKGKACENKTKEGPRTRRTSGKTNSTSGQPNLYRAGPRGGGKKNKKRSQNWAVTVFLFESFGSACPHASRMYFSLLSKKKLSCNTELKHSSITSNFCCDQTEPRKLHTPPTNPIFDKN